jgi:photosystem II stability/assembly factor-like uncharacterized protein
MKKSLLFSLLLLSFLVFTSSSILAQWAAQTSGTTQSLYAVKAINENVVWVGGSNGTLLKTTDGGLTWNPLTTVPNRAYSLDAIDENTAWIYVTNPSTGADSKIYKTTDGGTTWNVQYSNAANFGNVIKFFDANYGVAYGDPEPWPPNTDWEILVTTNGGTNWTRVPNTAYPPANSAYSEYGDVGSMAVYGNNVWFGTANSSGAAPFLARVYKSTDKGNTWTAVEVGGGVVSVSGISFKNNNVGVLCTYEGQFAKTTDGGATWTLSSTVAASAFHTVNYVPNSTRFLAVGTSGVTYLSIDDGATWSMITPHSSRLRDVCGAGATAFAVGDAGSIVKWVGPALPVELISFAASATGRKIELKWETATEINNKGFEVERKAVNSTWITVGFKEGSGTSTEAKNYSFIDDLSELTETSFSYRLKQIDYDGSFSYSSEVELEISNLPSKYSLGQNYPNPFNPSTKINYALPYESSVRITVFNAIGQQVDELINGVQIPGYYEISFNAKNITSGLYFYSIEASAVDGSGNFSEVKKMMLLR